MKKVILMSSISGAGKSTFAELLSESCWYDCRIVSNDKYPDYVTDNSSYDWTPEKAKLAAEWCFAEFTKCIEQEISIIIVDNTNLQKSYMKPYEDLAESHGYELCYFLLKPYASKADDYVKRNKHGVTKDIILKMIDRWKNLWKM